MVFLKSYLQQINAIYIYAFCFIPDIFKKKKTFKVTSDISLKSQYLYFLLLKQSEIVFSKLEYSISCVTFIYCPPHHPHTPTPMHMHVIKKGKLSYFSLFFAISKPQNILTYSYSNFSKKF